MWDKVRQTLQRLPPHPGKAPLAILDLDSTLIHTGARHRAIALAFPDPTIASVAEGLAPTDFGWDVRTPLAARGIDDASLSALLTFWHDRFFHSDWLHHDQAAPGAVAFTRQLHSHGVHIVYLTGRPEPAMGDGTRRSLKTLDFPTGDGTTLMMKPHADLPDETYKQQAAETLASLGPVAVTAENEPAHANGFAAAFPHALHLLIGDVHHPDAPEPSASVVRIADFLPLTPHREGGATP